MKTALRRFVFRAREIREAFFRGLADADGIENWLYARLSWAPGTRVRIVGKGWPGAGREIPYRVLRVAIEFERDGGGYPHVLVYIIDDRLRDDEEYSGGGYRGLYINEDELRRWDI